MKSKLIKLSETHYIIVDDSEIKVGYVFNSKGISQREEMSGYSDDYINRYWQKITHSTPIGGLSAMLEAGVKELSLSEVEEAINGYSVEEMADELISSSDNVDVKLVKEVWKAGFNTHKELVKDKLFTIEDVLVAANLAKNFNKTDNEIIQLLTPKTEWDIEFVDGKIKLK